MSEFTFRLDVVVTKAIINLNLRAGIDFPDAEGFLNGSYGNMCIPLAPFHCEPARVNITFRALVFMLLSVPRRVLGNGADSLSVSRSLC